MQKQDQTWYFVLADCAGDLEIYRDENKQETLLGLEVGYYLRRDEEYLSKVREDLDKRKVTGGMEFSQEEKDEI